MKNPTFSKSIYLLSHPTFFGAILLLLVNDHLLRVHWPSWLTGKLGDLAWLVMAPFLCASLLAWILPRSTRDHDRIVGLSAVLLTGAIFGLAKTIPWFHEAVVGFLKSVFGAPIQLVRDPSDLMTLPALLLSWRMWRDTPSPKRGSKASSWLALSLSALLTVANMAMPDTGISCLEVENNRVLAYSNWNGPYLSSDGGQSWKEMPQADQRDCSESSSATIADPHDPEVLYRFTAGKMIERSTDHGQNWSKEFTLTAMSEAESAYFIKSRSGLNAYRPGPLDAVADPSSGNVIFAMGHEGVLVRMAGGDWRWVPVGEYHPVEKMDTASEVVYLLNGEFFFIFGFGLLCASTFISKLKPRWHFWALFIISWIVIGLSVGLFPPALSSKLYYVSGVQYALYGLAAIFILATAGYAALVMYKRWRGLLAFSGIVALSLLLILPTPFVLWAVGVIMRYRLALVVAAVTGFALLALSHLLSKLVFNRDLPTPKD